MVKINIKKFSRSKDISEIVDSDETLDLVEVPVKKRGRPKKEAKVEPQVIQPEPEPEPPTPTPTPDPEFDDEEEDEVDDGNFLQELNNENFTTPETSKEESNETALIMKEMFKPPKKGKKQKDLLINDSDSLFGEDATPILGKDRRVLIAKLHQYKNLFPNELKKFKIKPNSSPEQLTACLSEMESIVETSSIDQFMTDSILQCIKLIETGTARTKYNISGTAEMLKSNPQFHNLVKQLYVKYNIFAKVPPEFQLVLLVGTTAMLCKTKNDKKLELESFLNEPIKKEM